MKLFYSSLLRCLVSLARHASRIELSLLTALLTRHLRGGGTLILLVAICVQNVQAQTLSKAEQTIVSEVAARADEAIALLGRSVNINSGTMNFEGVREVGRLYEAEFQSLGLETEWIDGDPFDRAGHLVARWTGSGDSPHILMIGHLDTVFEPSSPFQRFEREGDRAAGPGVVDMKGGNIVIIYALKALRAAGVLDALTLTVVLTGDEERSGRPLDAARAALVEAAGQADIALGFENGDSNPRTAVVARRGSISWRLDVTGTPAHSSQLFQPEVGSGAIYEAARILNDFHETLAGEPNLTFNPGVMVAGTDVSFDPSSASGTAFGKNNVVAEHAVVTGDLRAISSAQVEEAQAKMTFIARQNRPGASAVLQFDDGYPPLAPTEGNYRLLAHFDAVSRDLGYGFVTAVDPRNAGAADISFTAGLVDMALDGLGPGGGNDHTVDEWIDLPTLEMQTKRAAVLLWRLGNLQN